MTNISTAGSNAEMQPRSTARSVVSIILMITILFLPAGIAAWRRHPQTLFLLLATAANWLVALAWAFDDTLLDNLNRKFSGRPPLSAP